MTKSKATSVLLPSGRSSFRRVLRDEQGKAVLDESGAERVVTFSPGEAREVDADELAAIRDDIGVVLVIANDKGKQDEQATADFVAQAKAERDEEAAYRAAVKEEAASAEASDDEPAKPAKGRRKKADDIEGKE